MGARTPGSLFIESWGVNYISSSALLLYLNLSNLNLIIMAHFIFTFVCLHDNKIKTDKFSLNTSTCSKFIKNH